MNAFQVAIDGPVGAGKSTVARLVAAKAGFLYIDSGAMYRAVGLYAARKGQNPETSQEGDIAAHLGYITINLETTNEGQKVYLNGEDVTIQIRTPEASRWASAVAVFPSVRTFITVRARELSARNNVVMEGRDAGAVVLPNAQLKIYLDAAVDIRARRRYDELLAKGISSDFETVKQDVIQRDHNDSNRAADPLRKSDDAVVIDAGNMSAEEAADAILGIINERSQ